MESQIEFAWLIIGALAVYRLAYLTSSENGPGHIILNARSWVLRKYGAASWQFEGATCLFCQSVWYGVLVALAVQFGLHLALVRFALLALALSGLATLLHWWVLAKMNAIEA